MLFLIFIVRFSSAQRYVFAFSQEKAPQLIEGLIRPDDIEH